MSVRTDPDFDDADEAAPDDQSTSEACISKDDAFHILQNARRRAVLRYLSEHDEDRFVMRDIAEEVAAWEHDTTVQQLVSDERQRVYIALYQSHLPKLDEHGIIEYNQSRGIVEPTELTDAFEPYLDDGLHADSEITVTSEKAQSTEREGERGSSLTTAVSSLLNR